MARNKRCHSWSGHQARHGLHNPVGRRQRPSAIVGETLNQFIQRIRLEKAASQLIDNPKKSITEIAFDCGFSGSATFARAFKESFGISASQYRSGERPVDSKIRKTNRKLDQSLGRISKDIEVTVIYSESQTNNPQPPCQAGRGVGGYSPDHPPNHAPWGMTGHTASGYTMSTIA